MNGENEIGKVFGHINTEISVLRGELNRSEKSMSDKMHRCQMNQEQSLSAFKLSTSEKIGALTTVFEKYISAATEHENNQSVMIKKIFTKVDSHETRIIPLEEIAVNVTERKKEQNKLRISLYVAIATLILASLAKFILP